MAMYFHLHLQHALRVQQLLDHFSAANLSVQDAITELRVTLHADLCTKADIDVKEELE